MRSSPCSAAWPAGGDPRYCFLAGALVPGWGSGAGRGPLPGVAGAERRIASDDAVEIGRISLSFYQPLPAAS